MLSSTDDYLAIHRDKNPEGLICSLDVELLRRLSTLCTTEAPFRHINGTMDCQVDGVAMGSALGVTFANYNMAHIENTVISDLTVKPKLYARMHAMSMIASWWWRMGRTLNTLDESFKINQS